MRIAWQGQLACKGAKHPQGEVQALILVMQAAVAKMTNDGKALDKINLDKVLRAAKDAKKIGSKLLDVSLPNAIYWHAKVVESAGEPEEALEVITETIPMYSELADFFGEARAHMVVATCNDSLNRDDKAVDAAQEALKLYQDADDDTGVATAVQFLQKLGAIGGSPMPMQALPAAPMAPTTAAPEAASAAVVSASAAPKTQLTLATVKDQIIALAKESVSDDGDLAVDEPLMDAGVDSLAAVSFRNAIATKFEVQLPASLIFDYPSISAVAEFVHSAVVDG